MSDNNAPDEMKFCTNCENVSFHCRCAVDYRVEYIRKDIADKQIIDVIVLQEVQDKNKFANQREEILQPIRDYYNEVNTHGIQTALLEEFMQAIKETLSRADKSA